MAVYISLHEVKIWMSYFLKMNFWRTNNRSLVLPCLFSLEFMVFSIYFTVLVFLPAYLYYFGSHFAFLLCANRDLYNALLLYWYFHLHSSTTYDNLWIFRVVIRNFKRSNIAHIVGNNNATMLLLASWHCCYQFGERTSWSVAVFFVFRCSHMFVNLFIPIFCVHSTTCSQLSGAAHIIFGIKITSNTFGVKFAI